MRHEKLADGLSETVRELLQNMFDSGSSEQIAIADCLNTIASNGDEYATDEMMKTCAGELITAAAQIANMGKPEIAPPDNPFGDVLAAGREAVNALYQSGAYHVERCSLDAALTGMEDHLTKNVSNSGGTLELHRFPGRTDGEIDVAYLQAARNNYAHPGELEFDDDTIVSHSEEPDNEGAYVMGWQWVSRTELRDLPIES